MKTLALALLLIAFPLSAQTVDTLTTTTTTVIPRVTQATPSVVVQSPGPLNVDSLAAILAGMDRELVVVALDQGCDCGGAPWWWRAGLLGLGVGALVVWSRKETESVTITNSNEQSQEQTTTTTVRRGWWKKKHGR